MFSRLLSQTSASASTPSALLDSKIEDTAAGLPASYTNKLRSISEDNAAMGATHLNC